MSGLTLGDIRNALAATITAGVDRQTNVYPYAVGDPKLPAITIEPDSGDYVDYWLTFGAAGMTDKRRGNGSRRWAGLPPASRASLTR